MSMQSVASVRQGYRDARRRLMNPPNGRRSEEIEVVSESSLQRMEREKALLEKEAKDRAAHEARIAEIVSRVARQEEEWRQSEIAWAKRLTNRGVTATLIVDVCCEFYKVGQREILSDRRHAAICYPRHVIVYLCCTMTKKSLGEIGRFLNDRDHTTILSAKRKIANRLSEGDEKLAAEIAEIKKMLEVE